MTDSSLLDSNENEKGEDMKRKKFLEK